MRILTIIVVGLLSLGHVFAQLNDEQKKVFEISAQMRKVYSEHSSVQYSTAYSYYINSLDSNAIDTQKGEIKTQGENILQTLGGVTSIQNEDYTFVVNHDEKSMFLSVIMKVNGGASAVPFDLGVLDSMMYQIEVVSVEQKGKIHAFDIKLQQGEIERFYMSYNPETFVPQEMIIYYANEQKIFAPGNKQYIGKPILKINYSSQKVNQQIPDSVFSYKEYLRMISGELKPLEIYAKYSFYDTSKN